MLLWSSKVSWPSRVRTLLHGVLSLVAVWLLSPLLLWKLLLPLVRLLL